jgi:hypothetical protein
MVEGSCTGLIWSRLISRYIPGRPLDNVGNPQGTRSWGRDLNRRLPGVLTARLQLTVEISYLLRQRLCLPFVKFNWHEISIFIQGLFNFPCDYIRLGSDVISTAKSVRFYVLTTIGFKSTVFSVVDSHCMYQCRAPHTWNMGH